MCRMKGKSADQCQNYIRVLKLQTPETLFVCGTNAYKPRCRTYLITVSLPPSSAPPHFPSAALFAFPPPVCFGPTRPAGQLLTKQWPLSGWPARSRLRAQIAQLAIKD